MLLRQCNHGYCHSCVQKLKNHPDPGRSTVRDKKVYRCISRFCKTTISAMILDNYSKLLQSKEIMVNINTSIYNLHTANYFLLYHHSCIIKPMAKYCRFWIMLLFTLYLYEKMCRKWNSGRSLLSKHEHTTGR